MRAIVDTGYLVAIGNRKDRHHEWAVTVSKAFTEPPLTCEAVLSEAAYQLGSSDYILKLLAEGAVQVAFDCSRNALQLRELARQFADRKPDFADLCIIRMSELNPGHFVITVDERDFRVYRRNKREAIPFLSPTKPS